MDDTQASAALSALGNEVRLRIFRLLVRAGEEGLIIGDIVRHTGLAPSTLAHHLGALVQARLVVQERRGREIVNRADFAAMRRTLDYVAAECCLGVAICTGDAA